MGNYFDRKSTWPPLLFHEKYLWKFSTVSNLYPAKFASQHCIPILIWVWTCSGLFYDWSDLMRISFLVKRFTLMNMLIHLERTTTCQITPFEGSLQPIYTGQGCLEELFLWHLEVNSTWQIVVQVCHINSFGVFPPIPSFFLLLT